VALYLPVANLVALYPSIAERPSSPQSINLHAPLAGLASCLESRAARSRLALPWRRAVLVATALPLVTGRRAAPPARRLARRRRTLGTAVSAGPASPQCLVGSGNALLRRGVARRPSTFAQAPPSVLERRCDLTNLGVARQRCAL
jgi:hypothetical protein